MHRKEAMQGKYCMKFLIGASLSEPHHRRSTVKSVFLLASLLACVIPYMDDSSLHISTNLNTLMVH